MELLLTSSILCQEQNDILTPRKCSKFGGMRYKIKYFQHPISQSQVAVPSLDSRLVIERCQLYVIAEYERKLTENVKNKVCYIKKYVRFPFYVFHNFTFFSYKLDIEGFLRSFTSLYCWFLYYELLLINDFWFLVRLRYIRNIIIFYFPFWSSKLRWKKYWI